MAGGLLQLGGNRQRARVGLQRLDGRLLRGVDVTGETEIPRVTGGAGSGHRPGTRGGEFAVAPAGESRKLVRRRGGEAAHVGRAQPSGPGQRQVTGGAGGVRCLEVGRPDAMAVEAPSHRREVDVHSRRPDVGMALLARGQGVPARSLQRRPMRGMREPQIGGRWFGGGMPIHPALDGAVMTGGALHRVGPEGLPGLRRSHMAALAGGEQLGVLEMVKAIARGDRARHHGERQCGDRQQPSERAESHRPAPGLGVRRAGGSGRRSALVPNISVIPVYRRA